MKSMWKVFWGIFLLFGAVYLIVSRIWELPEISIFTVIMTIFLVSIVIQGIRRLNFFFILFGLALIGCQYRSLLGIEALTPWTLLGAAFLGSIGLSLLFKNAKKKWRRKFPADHSRHWSYFSGAEGVSQESCFSGAGGVSQESFSSDTMRFENTFSASSKYVNSDNFCRAEVENSFGTMTVYFDNAIIQNPTAFLNVENHFGTTHLYIPKAWRIELQAEKAFGTVMESGRWEGSSEHTLCIRVESSFGSTFIYYV